MKRVEFDLSKPQQLLRESARALLAQQCPLARVRELMATDAAGDENLWGVLADQGWLGLHVSEACGGLGLSLVELAVVAEELGRACLPGPFLATQWAATLLGEATNADLSASYLGPLAAGALKGTVALLEEDTGWDPGEVQLVAETTSEGVRVSGRKVLVLDAAAADLILCVARRGDDLAILLVPKEAAGLSLRATPSLDATRKLYELTLNGVKVAATDVVAVGARAEAALAQSMLVATLAVCGEMVGVMQWVLETTVEYAKTRQQFGKPIGAFQAVQHQCADMLMLAESARSATYFAAWALSAGIPDAARALSQAKAYCSDAAREVCYRGVQVHGGIGFTWEHDLHLFLKRAKACEALFGDATFHRERVARWLLDSAPSA